MTYRQWLKDHAAMTVFDLMMNATREQIDEHITEYIRYCKGSGSLPIWDI